MIIEIDIVSVDAGQPQRKKREKRRKIDISRSEGTGSFRQISARDLFRGARMRRKIESTAAPVYTDLVFNRKLYRHEFLLD